MTFLDPSTSYLVLLGVPASVDEATLTKRFRELSRQFHPDRFVGESSEIQDDALTSAALVNDAYRTLKDPFGRAEYLLKRERGVKLGELRDTNPPKVLFAEVLELQEALMEFQDGDASLRPTLVASQATFSAAYDALKDRLSVHFRQYDAGEIEAALDGMAEVAATRGYLRRVLENLDRTLKLA